VRNSSKVNIVRYADDFIVTGATKEVLADEVRPMVEQFLGQRGLSLSLEKTRITHIDDGFDFLGMNVRKYRGKLLISLLTQAFSASCASFGES
jgi:RNA-directed DNA polymerase